MKLGLIWSNVFFVAETICNDCIVMIMIYDANVPMVLFVVNDVQHIENNG